MAISLFEPTITSSGNLKVKILNDFPDGVNTYGDVVAFSVTLPDGTFVLYDSSTTLFSNASFVEPFDPTVVFDSFELSMESFISDNVFTNSDLETLTLDYTEFKDGVYLVNFVYYIDGVLYSTASGVNVFRKTNMTDCILDNLPEATSCLCDCDCDCGDCQEVLDNLDKILLLERGADIAYEKRLYDLVNDIVLQIEKICTEGNCKTC